ncbi:hypothetical protein EF910_32020 [Streptomyces sp. WAC07149]|uniref:hypothetical protein n=1 Tax=Streptomyces sp. WAC07149 TaxID=2487425 RepID=UPI000F7A41E7|nr:hypothetical protein [Streptomyces sp. WAC07149]RST00364.1 hypothetical protein EF910_32020 [Streptomyces sp. WAC07149]
MTDEPLIWTSSDAPYTAAIIRYPAGADPSALIAAFKPGTFTYDEKIGAARFDSSLKTAVLTELFKDWPRVQLVEGKSETELTYSNVVSRPAHIPARDNGSVITLTGFEHTP